MAGSANVDVDADDDDDDDDAVGKPGPGNATGTGTGNAKPEMADQKNGEKKEDGGEVPKLLISFFFVTEICGRIS
jgi:hypothetical protein